MPYVGVRETSVVDLSIFQMAAEAVTPAVVREFIRSISATAQRSGWSPPGPRTAARRQRPAAPPG